MRISLFNDTLFKIAFGTQKSRPALISLLNAFLDLSGDLRIAELELLPPNEDKRTIDSRGLLLDLKVRDQRGILYNVELQARTHPFYAERTLLYLASAYSNQLLSGDSYQKLRKTVHLSLLNFKLFAHQNPHSCFKLYDTENKLHLTDLLELRYLEFPKLKDSSLELVATAKDAWLYYFSHAGDFAGKPSLPPQLQQEGIRMTRDTINDALMDPIVQDALFNVEKRERAYQAEIRWNRLEAKEEGQEIGKEIGAAEANRANAIKMRDRGLDETVIYDITGLRLADLD